MLKHVQRHYLRDRKRENFPDSRLSYGQTFRTTIRYQPPHPPTRGFNHNMMKYGRFWKLSSVRKLLRGSSFRIRGEESFPWEGGGAGVGFMGNTTKDLN